MSVEKKTSLVIIPIPVISHLVVALKMAKLLVDRDERLFITVLIIKLPADTKISSYIKNSPDSRINFVELQPDEVTFEEMKKSPKITGVPRFVESLRGVARDAVAEIMESGRVAGIVVDMFCTAMIDVANELGVPAYIFFTCNASCLGLMFELQSFKDEDDKDLTEYEGSDYAISVPTFVNPVPARVWPCPIFDKESGFVDLTRRFRETKGIVVNTFLEFEPHAMRSLSADEKIPPVYSIGPIIQDEVEETEKQKEIIEWLDEQPDSSVVFLCFGSRGCFEAEQLKEIAVALELSGCRFLWSLRKPPPKDKMAFPGEYENPGEILPEGFLERTTGVGNVIGWAPQMAVLSHRALSGFVSHCGWNSTLESVWCGVPMAVWPVYAEQQANAFQLVKEIEMAVEIKMDYTMKCNAIIAAETIQKAIEQLMNPKNEIRGKVKVLKEKSREVLMKGGSSYNSLDRFIEDVVHNIL